MFAGTLKFNLDPEGNATDDEISQLLLKAQLGSLLDNDPAGIEQKVDENGSNLSSGERQLICICRAILRKSKLVILDEATANIDIVTEQSIQRLISEEFRDATMLTIAHRLNTIMASDKILLMENGSLKEYDTPSNLRDDPTSEFSKLLNELN